MSELTNEFERLLYKLAYRMVKSAIQEDHSGHIDQKISQYVDEYIKSPMIIGNVYDTIERICREDGQLELRVKNIVQDTVDTELRLLIAKRLSELKVGDHTFTDWLTKVVLKESLDSDSVKHAIDTAIKSRVATFMKDVLGGSPPGSSGTT